MTLLFAVACTNEAIVPPEAAKQTNQSSIRSREEAVEIALNLAEATAESRGSKPSVASVEVIGSSNSRSSSDTLIYAVNYADDKGFVLVSSSYATESVLGYTDNGTYDAERASQNDGFSFFLENAKSYVLASKDSIGSTIIPNPSGSFTTRTELENVLTTKWGQHYPEGIYCPNKVSGCVQTAFMQIMAFLEQPGSIALTYPDRDCEGQSFRWSEIKKHVTSVGYHDTYMTNLHLRNCGTDKDHHEALGRLGRELGYRNQAKYNFNVDEDKNSTSAATSYAYDKLVEILPNAGFTSYKAYDGNAMILSAMQGTYKSKRGIACIAGQLEDDITIGHTWLCDGVILIEETKQGFVIGGEFKTFVTSTYYFHYNWGYCGTYDGFFLQDVFNPEKSTTPPSKANYNKLIHYFVVGPKK